MLCEKWIWLPEDKYHDRQCCCYSDLEDDKSGLFTVAEFKREYAYGKKITSAKLRFSADTAFQLYINGNFYATGPASVGGDFLGESAMAEDCLAKRKILQAAVNLQLFDKEKGLYFEGLNTPSEFDFSDWKWMVANVEKRYYLKQSNILAAYVGICDTDTARSIIRKIMSDECPGGYQPYFAHYLLEAIYSNGLRDEYTLKVLERWKAPVAECPKGLVEGFIAPEPTYSFDHSHAWGGTPLWSLPKALTGFEMMKPAFEEVAFSPSLLGLEHARVELPTPYGDITVEMKQGSEPVITSPEEVKIILMN